MTENNEPKSWEEAAEREFAALEEQETGEKDTGKTADPRQEKTFRWYFSVIGEILLIVPIILVLYFLGKAFGAL